MRRLLLPCLAALLLGVPRSLAAQQGDPTASSKAESSEAKSPTTARLIGIIPGAGHMYAGETKRGVTFLASVLALGVLDGTLFATDCGLELYGPGFKCDASNEKNVLAVAVIGLWGWSIYDAGRAAQRTNAKHGLRTSLILAPQRSTGAEDGGRGVKLGLSIATR